MEVDPLPSVYLSLPASAIVLSWHKCTAFACVLICPITDGMACELHAHAKHDFNQLPACFGWCHIMNELLDKPLLYEGGAT